MQDRGVQGAPGVGAVRADRPVEEGGVRAVDEVEAAVAREEEGVALGRGLREGVERRRQGPLDPAYPEGAVQGREGVGERQTVEETVDRADPQGVAGGVDEEHQAVVPRAG